MVIDYPSQAFEPLARFKGGEKALNAKTFSDGTCRILRAYLEPGASIGMHEHAANCEVIYILSGSGTVVEDGGEKPVRAGQATYCERGRSHSLINTGAEDLHFFAVVPEVRQAREDG